MRKLFTLPVWVNRLRESPKSELTRWQRAVRFAIDLGVHCARELQYDRALDMAAALTFYTLFSLLPTIVIVLVALNAFVGPEDREAFKQAVVDWAINALYEGEPAVVPVSPPTLGLEAEHPGRHPPPTDTPPPADPPPPPEAPDPADVDDEPPLPGDVAPDDLLPGDPIEELAEPDAPATAEVLIERREEFERVRQRLDDELSQVLNALEQVDFRGIGAVGVLFFIYGATVLLATIEQSFNTIYGAQQGRPWYVRLPLYYTAVTLGPVVLVGAQVFQTRLFATLEVRDWTSWLVGPIGFVAPILATWLLLFLLYVLMPNAAVQKRAAAGGALTAAVVWAVTKDLFGLYVTYGVVGSLYGALALLPLFLLWLWLTWLIVLFGLELTFTLQATKGQQLKHELHKQAEQVLVDPAVLVVLATRLAAAFERGRTVGLSELTEAAKMPARVVRQMMRMLEQAHIVHRVQDTLTETYALARPADRIRLDEVLDAAEALLPTHTEAPDEETRPAWRFIGTLHDASHRLARQRTLEQLLRAKDGGTGTKARRRGGTQG